MNSNLDNLPATRQIEMRRIADLQLRGVEAAIVGGIQHLRHGAKVLKIILFNSSAREHLVDPMYAMCGTRLAELQHNAEQDPMP